MLDKSLPPGEYCIYLRKSRKDLEVERNGGGDTLARHQETLLALARRLGLNVTYIYKEVVSGDTIAERPQMQKLLDAVEQNLWKGVLVTEIARLARGDTVDQGIVARAVRYSNTLIVTPEKIYYPEDEFDEEYMEFGLFMSRQEYKAINRRIQRGRVFSVHEGKWVSHKTPYGWRRVKLPKEKGYTLEPDPDTAPIVSMLYDWAYDPQPVPDGAPQRLKPPTIANRLNDMGVPSPTGVKWTPCAVRNILRNPVNAGWVRWGNRAAKKKVVGGEVQISRPLAAKEDVILVPGRHQPLVSQEVFDSVQAYISGPSRPGPKQVETKNPLAGLIICGGCGHAMVRRPYQSGRQETLLCPQSYCHTVASDLAVVEAAVLDALRSWLCKFEVDYASTKASLPADHDPAASLRPILAQAEKSLAQLTAQEQRAYTLVEQGVYTPEIFLERSRAITAQQTTLRQQIDTITAQIQELEYRDATQAQIIPTVRAVLDSYPLAQTPQEKNDLLRSVLEKAVYTKTRRERSKGGSDMTITLYPKLPTPPPSSPLNLHFDCPDELGHLEMVGAVVHQLTRNLKVSDIEGTPFAAYFVDHTAGVYPQFASGYPWSASTMQSTGDVIADLTEDLAAEQKARLTYDNILRLAKDDPDVTDVIRFLREREIVHFQRFGEAIELAKQRMDQKNIYFTNPAFDK